MLRSISCTRLIRTWKSGMSRYLGKRGARHRPAPAGPTLCTTEGGQPLHTPLSATHTPANQPGSPPSRRPPTRRIAWPTRTCPPLPSPGPGMPTTGGRPSGKSIRATRCSSLSWQSAGIRSGSWGPPRPTTMGQHPLPTPSSQRRRHGTGYTPSCGPGRSPPSGGSTWCGSPPQPPTTTAGQSPEP